jgi:hypothetical protein
MRTLYYIVTLSRKPLCSIFAKNHFLIRSYYISEYTCWCLLSSEPTSAEVGAKRTPEEVGSAVQNALDPTELNFVHRQVVLIEGLLLMVQGGNHAYVTRTSHHRRPINVA